MQYALTDGTICKAEVLSSQPKKCGKWKDWMNFNQLNWNKILWRKIGDLELVLVLTDISKLSSETNEVSLQTV